MPRRTVFSVAPGVFEQFPDYIIGWVIARGVQNTPKNAAVEALLAGAEDRARLLYAEKDLKDEPAVAVWRTAFAALGWPASTYPASVEAILKRVSRGGSLPRINPAVDLANAAALLYLAPVGCHDLETSAGLQVRPAAQTDYLLPMGNAESETPRPGEIVYAAGSSVRTRRWVWRQSREALVGTGAATLLFPINGFSIVTRSRVESATEFLATACREQLSTDVTIGMFSLDQPGLP